MLVVTREDNKTVVRPSVENIVAAILPEMRTKLRALVEEGVRDLEFDLAGVNMVDSSGIGLIVSAYNSLRKVGGRMTVTHVSPELLELFQSMRMHQHFNITGN